MNEMRLEKCFRLKCSACQAFSIRRQGVTKKQREAWIRNFREAHRGCVKREVETP